MAFVLRRLAGSAITIFLIAFLAFSLIRVAPGGPFSGDRAISPEIEEQLNRAYHLDEPVLEQFYRYLQNLLKGDFGPSYRYRDRDVSEIIGAGLPISATIGALALAFAVILGVIAGTVAALNRNTWVDHTVMMLALSGVAVPTFVMAPLLALFFGVWLEWLPVAGWESRSPLYLVLPVVSLGLPHAVVVARLMRAGMLEVLTSGFIRTARAKGVSTARLLRKHAFRPALMPVITYLAPASAGVLTGSVVVEQIFAIPGIGRFFVQGAINRDYTLVMGMVILFGTLLVLANLVVDLLYRMLDPRVSYD